MRLRFHGLRLSVEGDARAVAAAAELLDRLPVAEGDAPIDVRVLLRSSSAQGRPPGARAFYHGVVDCHVEEGGLVLSDGFSRSRISEGGSRVEVDVAEESLRDGYLFAHVLLFISIVLALRSRGLFHLHAGSLVTPGGDGLLVAGHAGSGKSTLTVALLEAGCGHLGDDAVFLEAAGEGVRVLAMPRPFHVAPGTAAAFPRVAALLTDHLPAGEKRRLDPRAAWPGREREAMDAPRVLLFPRITGAAETVVERVSSAEALGELVESSTLVVVDGLPRRDEHLDVLRRIADGGAAFAVGLGRDLLAAPAEVARRVLDATAPF
jgi:hypothetical protein